jgi:hypothetical protein
MDLRSVAAVQTQRLHDVEGRAGREHVGRRQDARVFAVWVEAGVFAIGAVVVGSLMQSIKIEADAPAEPTSEPQLARS